MKTLNEICHKVDIPVVAIGGINQVNVLEFIELLLMVWQLFQVSLEVKTFKKQAAY